MANIDLVALANRMVALEKEGLLALSTPVTCDAKPYWFHEQEAFPYWINRITDFTLDVEADDWGEEIDTVPFVVQAGLIIGNRTSGYKGERDAELQLYVPHMMEWFNEHESLRSATAPYTTDLDYLIRCRVTGGSAHVEFPTGQIGALFLLRAEFVNPIEQEYN